MQLNPLYAHRSAFHILLECLVVTNERKFTVLCIFMYTIGMQLINVLTVHIDAAYIIRIDNIMIPMHNNYACHV